MKKHLPNLSKEEFDKSRSAKNDIKQIVDNIVGLGSPDSSARSARSAHSAHSPRVQQGGADGAGAGVGVGASAGDKSPATAGRVAIERDSLGAASPRQADSWVLSPKACSLVLNSSRKMVTKTFDEQRTYTDARRVQANVHNSLIFSDGLIQHGVTTIRLRVANTQHHNILVGVCDAVRTHDLRSEKGAEDLVTGGSVYIDFADGSVHAPSATIEGAGPISTGDILDLEINTLHRSVGFFRNRRFLCSARYDHAVCVLFARLTDPLDALEMVSRDSRSPS